MRYALAVSITVSLFYKEIRGGFSINKSLFYYLIPILIHASSLIFVLLRILFPLLKNDRIYKKILVLFTFPVLSIVLPVFNINNGYFSFLVEKFDSYQITENYIVLFKWSDLVYVYVGALISVIFIVYYHITLRFQKNEKLVIKNARENNLKNIDVEIPLGVMTVVSGVSGSGKSTLVNEILSKELLARKHRAQEVPGAHDEILGLEKLDKAIVIDQSAIGRTPRSNPATYTGVFTQIRELFAGTPEANIRGYKAGRFSFNVKGGRCENCQGDGVIKIEMHFLPDVYVQCDECHGKRYNREALEIKYKDKTIADVLDMTIDQAAEFFDSVPNIARKLQTLVEVGLGYIKLGQPATTFSGGEAQRIKLATELARASTGKTIYILDEPTTGLHNADVKRLLSILNRLVDAGNSMVIIEHNLDMVKSADWLIDMGPEGGAGGGIIVATGTPEQVSKVQKSWTGKYLKSIL